MARKSVIFEMERDYASKALKSPDMQLMITKKAKLAQTLYKQRVAKRSGENARSTRIEVQIGGEKMDRWEAEVVAYAQHALYREFGSVDERGGSYAEKVAARYGRSVRGRALSRSGGPDAVLGGDSRRRQSVVESLEEM